MAKRRKPRRPKLEFATREEALAELQRVLLKKRERRLRRAGLAPPAKPVAGQ